MELKKKYYDRKAGQCSFEVGENVLVVLPTSTKKLLANSKGPVYVTVKVNVVDYRIQYDHDVIKVYHIDMLKRWIKSDDGNGVNNYNEKVMTSVCHAYSADDDEWIGNPLMHVPDTVKDVKCSQIQTQKQGGE